MNKNILLIVICCFGALLSNGQLPVPKLTKEKLKIFEPFFGKYKHTMTYTGIKWSGTMEIKPIIKGWYVDWTIFTKSQDNKIDREYHMLVTYDTAMNKYRVWRFETLPHNDNEITVSTDGADIIVDMKVPPLKAGDPDEIFSNRYSKPSNNQIKIVSEFHSLDGKVTEHIGVTNAAKIK